MIKISRAVLVIVLLVRGQSAIGSACIDSAIPRGESRSSVKLLTDVEKPYFYFRTFDYNFAVLVTAKSIRSALESASSNGSKDAGNLLKLIAKDLPLIQNTDLFKYVLLDYYQLSVIQRTLVELLESGDAAVFDAETGHLSETIELRRNNSEHIRARAFYDPNKEVLFRSVDCIEN